MCWIYTIAEASALFHPLLRAEALSTEQIRTSPEFSLIVLDFGPGSVFHLARQDGNCTMLLT